MKTGSLKIQICTVILLSLALSVLCMAEEWGQIKKLLASDRDEQSRFGWSVSVSEDYAIVGATGEARDVSGGDTLYGAGAAYIFFRSGDNWIQQQKLVASDRDASELFGYSVCISGDYAVVGAVYDHHNAIDTDSLFRSGSAYVFKKNGETWVQDQKLAAPDRMARDNFGISVSISGDFAIVGAISQDLSSNYSNPVPGAGAAYIYARTDSGWFFHQKITAPVRHLGDAFGSSVSISGDDAIVGAYEEDINPDFNDSLGAGAAYIFKRIDTVWVESQRLVAPDRHPSDNFGTSVSICGDYAMVGSPRHDYDTSAVVTPQAGAAYLYARQSDDWVLQQKIFDTTRYRDHHFGYSVSISGSHAVAGTEGANYAYMFARDGNVWMLQKQLKASDHVYTADFGWAVSVSGEYAMVGAHSEWRDTLGENFLSDAGAVYIYGHTSTGAGEREPGELPAAISLSQNFPNPFNPTTEIRFVIKEAGFTTIRLYDLLGREVATLVNEMKHRGAYAVQWDATGRQSGVYYCRMESGRSTGVKKLLFIK